MDESSSIRTQYCASIIIPAHNEERSIGRLLTQLSEPSSARRFEVVIACNGCTDNTASIAQGFGATVLDLPEPSKRAAMRAADLVARSFPRVYLDADVEISANDVERLADVVRLGPILASAPGRRVPRDGVALVVRWYYDVWESLPQVRAGLFGRGVIALSESGYARVRALPDGMSDDLVISEAFSADERWILTDATVTVHPPRTVRDLLRRRVRVVTGNVQADHAGTRTPVARTSLRTLWRLTIAHPEIALKIPLFLLITAIARTQARRAVRAGDFTTWNRDDSSRV